MTIMVAERTKIKGEQLEPFVKALLGASGITEEQAKICLLYALCTYRTTILEKLPMLAIIGMTGTSKSAVLEQMLPLVNAPHLSKGATYATVRNEMAQAYECTYLNDEADKVSEDLLLKRTDKNISQITYNKGMGHGWSPQTVDIFGGTVLARRNPFRDSAVRNRAIVIRTKKKPGGYKVEPICGLEEIFQEMKPERLSLGSGRVEDTWLPLLEIARAIDDSSYEEAVEHAMEAEQNIFKSGQEYEATEVVLYALDKLTWDTDKSERIVKDIELSELTSAANDIGDVELIKKMAEELLISMGFRVTFTHGTKFVRSDVGLLESLL
ncbi:hypothetical protein ACFLVG_02910 [Chloroflexota bacterium]